MKIVFTKDRVLFLVYAISGVLTILWAGNPWAMIGGALLIQSFLVAFGSFAREHYEAGYQKALDHLPEVVNESMREYQQEQTRIYDGQRWRKIGKDC